MLERVATVLVVSSALTVMTLLTLVSSIAAARFEVSTVSAV